MGYRAGNSITDVLAGLTRLVEVGLDYNPGLADLRPLLENRGIGAGDTVFLGHEGRLRGRYHARVTRGDGSVGLSLRPGRTVPFA